MRYVTHKRAEGDYQDLKDHLGGVAKLAAEFAEPFEAAEQAKRMGLLHDIGKYGVKAQARQFDPEHTSKCDHSTAGAKEAYKLNDPAAAFAIAGHHGGLPKMGSRSETQGSLLGRVMSAVDDGVSAWESEISLPDVKPAFDRDTFSLTFFTRMLFSCLVDADFLDTERFMHFGQVERSGGDNMDALFRRLQNAVQPWLDQPRGELGKVRNEILRACLNAGKQKSGFFSLTVPTGGGKTIASMAFALSHAVQQKKRRVIYVIPYTSIIEQNAAVFAEILGKENVLEHHGNVAFDGAQNDLPDRRILATENWDAPVIVTSAVQFFESLFAAKPSKCRKLHNLADSVIVFDEAQMLPMPFLRPCVRAIAELVRKYGVSAVLCTATQPSLGELIRESLSGAQITELCPDVPGIFQTLRRVTFRKEGLMTDDAIAQAINGCKQALCIVGSRKRAKAVYEALLGEGCFHLSTLMTPNHRQRVLSEIRKRLKNGLPCRVVATSLIEAGVDVDFPEVWREMAGLDSILQAAGRCNREGHSSADASIVHVFIGAGEENPLFAINAAATRTIDRRGLDYAEPATVTAYFDALMNMKGDRDLDRKGILELLGSFDFPAVEKAFKLIEENTLTVYIPTKDNMKDIERIRDGEISRGLLRRLGKDAVSVYPNHFKKLEEAGAIDSRRDDGYGILVDDAAYREEDGLSMEAMGGGLLFA